MLKISPSVHATSVTWSLDGNIVLVALGNGTVAAVEARSNTILQNFLSGNSRSCFGTAFLNSDEFMSWSSDGFVKKWDLLSGATTDSFNLPNFSAYSACLIPNSNGRMMVAGNLEVDLKNDSEEISYCCVTGNVYQIDSWLH